MKTGNRSLYLARFVSLWVLCASGQSLAQGKNAAEEPLPTRTVVIDVNAPTRTLYKIAIPNFGGDPGTGASGAEVLRNDLKLSSLFEVLNPKSFIANLEKEGVTIDPKAWVQVGAQAVVKGQLTIKGSELIADLYLYEVGKGGTASLNRRFQGPSANLRTYVHQFANQVLAVLTGEAGHFDTKITFARRQGPGRKDVYISDYDGNGVGRVSSGKGIAMLPAFGPGGVWYSILSKKGMFVTNANLKGKAAIGGSGLNMGVTFCDGRVFFSSTRDGNSEIYSAKPDGSGITRLTNHSAIDISPSCGPGGKIAFVSDRHGSPQIFTMTTSGGDVKRVTYRGNYNQTPAWCMKPDMPLIAFTGRDSGTDVFTINLKTGEYKRLTQGQGINKDPAFSPDCRMVVFTSSRGGVYVMNPDGLNQTRIINGGAETIRWSR